MRKILIKNAHIWDGEAFSYGSVLICGTQIAALGSVPENGADIVLDAAGKTVSAGLVDAHVHFKGISPDCFGMQAEMGCFPFGVTAAADCCAEQGDLRRLEETAVRTAVFVPARIRGNRIDAEETVALIERFGERTVGIKIYYDTKISEVRDIRPLREICRLARKTGLKVCVHTTRSPVSMTEIVRELSPGDILTHIYHGGVNTARENGFEALLLAREKGIVLDSGHAGHVHTDFALFREAVDRGLLPDTISTDLTCSSAYVRGGVYGMTLCMSLYRALGVPQKTVLRAVTASPADALSRKEWGRLRVGGAADLTVLDEEGEGFAVTDEDGHTLSSDFSCRCCLTAADGQILYRR